MGFSFRGVSVSSPRPREDAVASEVWVEGTSWLERWSVGGWATEEGSWALFSSAEVLEVAFCDWSRPLCAFG